jgi:hypothetical protein
MTPPPLGRLTRVELRDIWTSEAVDFTAWLARPENIAVLGEALGIYLELEAQEKAVGPFRADIQCKDIGTDHWVLCATMRASSNSRRNPRTSIRHRRSRETGKCSNSKTADATKRHDFCWDQGV